MSERIRVDVMGVGVDIALGSRLSDAKSALCRSRAVMLKVVNKSRTQKFRRSHHNEKKKVGFEGLVEFKRDSWRR